MSRFYDAFNRPEIEPNPVGSETQDTYGYRIDKKTGKRILVKTGTTNIYEMIQASHESTKLVNIIKRATGDPTILEMKNGQYIDISEMPTNMFELQNMILQSKEQFEKLPIELKNKFDNSVEKYVSMYGSDEWLTALGLKETKKEEIKEEKKGEENE